MFDSEKQLNTTVVVSCNENNKWMQNMVGSLILNFIYFIFHTFYFK